MSIISRYSYNNVSLAKDALEKIESEEVRKKAVTHIYKSIRYRSQSAAKEFLEGRSEIPEEEKESLLSQRTGR